MKFLVICMLIIAGILFAGCTGTQVQPLSTPAPTKVPVTTTAVTTETPRLVFTLGSRYLEDPGGYRLLTENDTVIKEFRVDSPSWGVYFKVQPLSDDLQYCWFVVDVTNVDMNTTESFGYGRDHLFESEQWIPMYEEGPYKLTMKGNNVKVWLTAAKRMP
ncbi:MAG: hypothetical protein WCB46_08885 [Methanoregula sp.]